MACSYKAGAESVFMVLELEDGLIIRHNEFETAGEEVTNPHPLSTKRLKCLLLQILPFLPNMPER